MTYTAEARRTTQAHQAEQSQINALALREMLAIWPAWNPEDLDATWEPVLVGLLGVGEHYYRLSSMRAAAYYARLRELSGVPGRVVPERPEFDRAQATNNLMLLGPIFTKKAISKNKPVRQAMDTALVRVQGAVTAMVLAGARDTIQLTSDRDPQALGTRRITAGTCSWCLQLKAWGQDGKGPMVPGRSFKGHTNCKCLPEPGWDEIDPAAMTEAEGGPFKPDQPFEQLGAEGRSPGRASDNDMIGMGVKDRYEQVVSNLLGGLRGDVRSQAVQAAAKKRVAERVGTRMDGRFLGADARKLKAARDDVAGSAWDYGVLEQGGTNGQSLVASLVGEWAGTSGDSSPLALALQKTAAKRFDQVFDPTVWRSHLTPDSDTVKSMNALIKQHGEVFEAFVEEMYKETQDLLDLMYPGQSHIPLGRGYNVVDASAVVPGSTYTTKAGTVFMNPMSSMSVSEQIADSFGQIQIRAMVPKERIIGTPLSGYGCLHEYEFVVIGAREADPAILWKT